MQKVSLTASIAGLVVMMVGCAGGGVDGVQAKLVGRQPGSTKAGLGVAVTATAASHGNGGGGNQVLDMDQIIVSVAAVAAHAAGAGWVQVSDQPTIVDLLRLQDSADALGFAHLPAGKITQIRLYVVDDGQSHVVTKEGVTQLLTIPSGFETGVKLQGPFDLGACENGLATGVVDLEKSILVHGHGNHDDMILRPTIHRTDYDAVPADICDPSGGGDQGVPVPGGDDGNGGNGGGNGNGGGTGDGTGVGGCAPNTEGCGSGSTDPGAGTGTGTGTGDPIGDPGTGTRTGTGTGTGTRPAPGTTDPGTGTGTGTGGTGSPDPGTCDAPTFVEGVGLICL